MSKYMGALNDAITLNHTRAVARYVGDCWGNEKFEDTLQNIKEYLNECGYSCRGMEFDMWSNKITDKNGYLVLEILKDDEVNDSEEVHIGVPVF